ncbi:MAG: TlyA family RNA methyltransferase [Pseudomonadota bacterium]|nr:TlyA family RNA methyltransferase [Pseudomonadota bacterium]
MVLVSRGVVETRQRAQALIAAGEVLVDEVPCDKPATRVRPEQAVRLRAAPLKYVSRGGLKLEGALDAWPVDPTGRVCADLGASTGGFTDCLLQRGAARIYAVDVGYGQLAWKLRQDPRVVVMERTNARHLTSLPEPITLLVGDLSFISLTLILPTIRQLLAPAGEAVVLVKPQFEVGPAAVGKGGLVKDDSAIAAALETVAGVAARHELALQGSMESPVLGAKAGNREWLFWLRRSPVVS